MRVLVELYREECAQVTIDTAAFPVETAGWDSLDIKQLRDQASTAAWELVKPTDWESEDSGYRFVRVLGDSE